MGIIKHIVNFKGYDSEEIMNKIIHKIFYSAYGKDFKKMILIPIKNNDYCDLQIEVQYTVDKRKKSLRWKGAVNGKT